MRLVLPLLFFLAQSFWETKPPEKWTDREIMFLCSDSPWAQSVGPAPNILVYFATSLPIEEAEGERRLRTRNTLREPDADYLTYLSENRDKEFVLAIPSAPFRGPKAAEGEKRLEEESVMIVDRKTYQMVGHFPPTESDPVLRLVFPREVRPSDRKVVFRLYLPGIEFPDREVEFNVKEMVYHGKLEM